jgi:epoxyqueuosine reductase
MHYLVRGLDRRKNPELVFPDLKSVFCVLLPYRQSPLGHTDPAVGPRYARYLDGPDYHDRIQGQLAGVLEAVRALPEYSSLRWKICVDTSAVLERTWAAICGLGWIGKNTLLIHPRWGSRFFIGVAFLDQEVHRAPSPVSDYCGNCTRCLEACPTGAFPEPHLLDARSCISYWTLEKRGELELTTRQKRAIGNWVAGCDICQDACPFNLKPERKLRDPVLENGAANYHATWMQLSEETESAYRNRVSGSALSRVKPEMARRNLEIARSNSEANPNGIT